MTPFQRAFRQQFESQRRINGIDVIYSRGSDSASITVIPATTVTTVEDSQTRTQLKSFVRDYLILPDDLELSGSQIYPKAGDEILEADGASYRVVRELAGEPSWRWDDQQTKQVMRVHTELIAGT